MIPIFPDKQSESQGYFRNFIRLGFEVLFSNPIVIPKQQLHRVEASVSGANSYSGQKGREAVVFHSDVSFIFDNSSESSTGTRVERG